MNTLGVMHWIKRQWINDERKIESFQYQQETLRMNCVIGLFDQFGQIKNLIFRIIWTLRNIWTKIIVIANEK